jgi:hypothetical protein
MSGRGVLAASAAGLLVVGVAQTPAQAAGAPMVLSNTSGPSGGGNTITATITASQANPTPFAAGTTPMVQFQFSGTGSGVCTAAPRAIAQIAGSATALTAGVLTVNPTDVQPISTTRMAITVPSSAYPATNSDGSPNTFNPNGLALLPTQATSKWNVCAYDTGNLLIGTAVYTLAVRPRITAILPASSPALGGQTIAVNGAGFTTTANGTTASIGGVAATNVRVASSGTSFTATTPPHVPGTGLSIVINTAGGPVSSADPDNNGLPQDTDDSTPDAPLYFSYTNGIQITPTAAAAGAKVNLDIKGTSFDSLTFNRSGTPTDSNAHVFLVRDAYSPGTNRGVQECTNVRLVGSSELVCSLDLAADRLSPSDSSVVSGTPVANGTYTVTVVANGATDATDAQASASIVSTGATFTVAPY